MSVDDERKKRVDFGPAYFMIESTYLATGTSGIKTLQRRSAREMRRWRCRNTRLKSLPSASDRAPASTPFGERS
jgi:hypothetical protein